MESFHVVLLLYKWNARQEEKKRQLFMTGRIVKNNV
jgi:hypothetical protein